MKTVVMKSAMKKAIIISLMALMVFVSIVSQTQVAEAKSVCSSISGSTAGRKSFYVETSSGWTKYGQYLTLTKSKGVYKYNNWLGNTKTMNQYGFFYVTVYNTKTRKTTTYNWYDGTLKIRLDRYSSYIITVIPMDKAVYQSKKIAKGSMVGWKSHSWWNVKKTKNLTLCNG